VPIRLETRPMTQVFFTVPPGQDPAPFADFLEEHGRGTVTRVQTPDGVTMSAVLGKHALAELEAMCAPAP
jgi:hypothetical protein